TIVSVVTLVWGISPRQPSGKNIIRWLLKKEQMVVSAIASTPHAGAFISSTRLSISTPYVAFLVISVSVSAFSPTARLSFMVWNAGPVR
ncbi:hypothetical protein, partial [Shigella boydii]|uniref:hypothetical protein n=1 Tax=Shigella boydii TaxID=621 RepID=UPI0025B69510